MGFKCGIVGLPNVGKSTLFNALTGTIAAQAANYPFCTIDPNEGLVAVPDKRLDNLAQLAASKTIIPTQLTFMDIAGLVKGASQGEGLGNQFLGHIREVDAIIHMVRCFEDEDITHLDGEIDPLRDIQTIETELMLSDLESVERRLESIKKKTKRGDKEAMDQERLLQKAYDILSDGRLARPTDLEADDMLPFAQLGLLTSKKMLYVCNVSEDDVLDGNDWVRLVEKKAAEDNMPCLTISANIEAEIAQLSEESEKTEFLESIGLSETGLSRLIRAGYDVLGLITYFTVGPKEARAWTVQQNTSAPAAAGVIHTDFEKGFIRAETIAYNDYIDHQGEAGCREKGKLRLEGKDYIVQDGDVLHFRFNV
jgi:GTP-binding protein YchF